jgi:hypothetical protein
MVALLSFFLTLFASLFKSKSRLEAENAALRHQLIVLRRRVRGRTQLTNGDRLFLIQLYRWFPSVLRAITIIRPGTLVRWHRAGFRRYWRWKSRFLGGRPQIDAELRALIRRMSADNPLWGAPRIHASQGLAQRLLDAGSLGIIYPSVRRDGGTCRACFRPPLVMNVRKAKTYQFTWKGKSEPEISVISSAQQVRVIKQNRHR